MRKILQEYTLVLTIKVRAEEKEHEIDHTWLWEKLDAMFHRGKGKTVWGKIEAIILKRELFQEKDMVRDEEEGSEHKGSSSSDVFLQGYDLGEWLRVYLPEVSGEQLNAIVRFKAKKENIPDNALEEYQQGASTGFADFAEGPQN